MTVEALPPGSWDLDWTVDIRGVGPRLDSTAHWGTGMQIGSD